jgi:hypothetical protein
MEPNYEKSTMTRKVQTLCSTFPRQFQHQEIVRRRQAEVIDITRADVVGWSRHRIGFPSNAVMSCRAYCPQTLDHRSL